jgi:BirA family transcriptional regulator, biotin operon repressor / biotin---[acetyl-CoA-carboxylase] ligase
VREQKTGCGAYGCFARARHSSLPRLLDPGGSLLTHPPLLQLLADGEVHSGESLAAQLRQTRAAVWKGVERLRATGIEVQALARRGYRLARPVELLDVGRIRAELADDRLPHLHGLELLFEVGSTNTRLLSSTPPPPGTADVCLAELQHAGRGRLGRRWVAPFGGGIAMSLGWTCSDVVRTLPALSLGVGVAVSRGLMRVGASGVTLKWPNDIWFEDRKLGGVLIELRAEAGGPAHVVIGVGINVSLPAQARHEIEASGVSPAAATDACTQPVSRNMLAGAILDELLSMLLQYERFGFAAFRAAWTALDGLNGRPAQVLVGENVVSGIARGVDADGALLLETEERLQRFVSGEASLRLING